MGHGPAAPLPDGLELADGGVPVPPPVPVVQATARSATAHSDARRDERVMTEA
jgi:hypothetical protein